MIDAQIQDEVFENARDIQLEEEAANEGDNT